MNFVRFGAIAGHPLQPLSEEECAEVFDQVMRMQGIPVAEEEPPALAAAVPTSIDLQDLPTDVAGAIPRVQGYKFAKFDDRILLVHPHSRKVIAEMPRYKLVLQ
jgi:hypothetical protein